MQYLTVKDVIFIKEIVVQESGGSIGIRDLGLIDSAVNRPRASFGGEDLYPSVFDKAAAMFHAIAFNHAFLDGNKRTAATSTGQFLELNSLELEVTNEELENFTVSIVEQKLEVEQIAEWLETNSNKIN